MKQTMKTLWCLFKTYEWKVLSLICKTWSIYRNVKEDVTDTDFFFSCKSFWTNLFYKNIKTGQPTREKNLCPWEFQQTVGRPDSKNYYDIVNEDLQRSFYINFRVLVCRISMVSNKIGFIMTYNYIWIF